MYLSIERVFRLQPHAPIYSLVEGGGGGGGGG